MTREKTLEVIGVKTVHICTLTNNTKRATMAVTIAANGTVLPDDPTRIHTLRKYVAQAEDKTSVELARAKQ